MKDIVKKQSSTETTTNSGDSMIPGREKGQAFPSPRKRGKGANPSSEYLYRILGEETADKLIREAHGLLCKYCEEPIGELKTATTSYGWMHHPEGKSYTFCKTTPTGAPLDPTDKLEATPKFSDLKEAK